MIIGEYYSKAVEVVEDVTGISASSISGKRKLREIVDARWLLAWLMCNAGYYPRQVAELMNLSTRMVQKILQEFDNRVEYSPDIMLRNNKEIATKKLRNN